MGKIKDKIVKMFWHDSEETNYLAIQGKTGKFDLKLGDLLVGILTFENGIWKFVYSDDYKNQSQYDALANFPILDKVYESENLWPFFQSRLPGNAQLENDVDNGDIITLLKKYGSHVITNPFVLT